jgi:hypothetical protein
MCSSCEPQPRRIDMPHDVIMDYLCGILLLIRLPALSLFPGHSPAQLARCAAVGNELLADLSFELFPTCSAHNIRQIYPANCATSCTKRLLKFMLVLTAGFGRNGVFTVSSVLGRAEDEPCQARPRLSPALFNVKLRSNCFRHSNKSFSKPQPHSSRPL